MPDRGLDPAEPIVTAQRDYWAVFCLRPPLIAWLTSDVGQSMSIERQVEILPSLRDAVSAFLYPLKTTREVKKDAFARLESIVVEATRVCKTDDLLSKALVAEVFITTRAIEPEEGYVAIGDRVALRAMREKLDRLFYLLIDGESPEDRQPGVPRVL